VKSEHLFCDVSSPAKLLLCKTQIIPGGVVETLVELKR
jgi:hypothetical protein